MALDCLCKKRFQNAIVYMAAHGSERKIGDVDLISALVSIGLVSKSTNITGVMLGSCYTGKPNYTMEACIEGTNISWCAGYSSSSYWLSGTLIDCAIIAQMLELDDEDLGSSDVIQDNLTNAIDRFSIKNPIGTNEKNELIPLEDSLQFVTQASGRGQRARNISSMVFQQHWDNIEDDEVAD